MNRNLHLTKDNIYMGTKFMQMEKELNSAWFFYLFMLVSSAFNTSLIFSFGVLFILGYILKTTLDIQKFESVMIAFQDLLNEEEGYIPDEEDSVIEEEFEFKYFFRYLRPYVFHFIGFIICGYILLPNNILYVVMNSVLWFLNCSLSVFFFDYYRRSGGNNFKDENIFKGGK